MSDTYDIWDSLLRPMSEVPVGPVLLLVNGDDDKLYFIDAKKVGEAWLALGTLAVLDDPLAWLHRPADDYLRQILAARP